MKITSIQTTQLMPKINKSNNYFTNFNKTNPLVNDVFVKNSSNLSFKASNGDDDDDTWTALAILTSCVGGTILLNSILKATTPESDYIFSYNGSLLGRKSVFQKEAKFKEMLNDSGIDMSSDRFTYADPINGIYRNPGKGIDINLLKEKYVDPENGIYIDKEQGVSAIFKDNEFKPIVMRGNPTFEGSSMSNWSSRPPYPIYKHIDRDDFIEQYGKAPEDMDNFREVYKDYRGYDGFKFHPTERRNFVEKIYDYLTERDEGFTHDHWGREVVTVKDFLGREHKVPLDDQISDMIDKHNLRYEDVQYFTTYMAKNPIQGYIKDIPLSEIQEYAINRTSLSEFLAEAKAKSNPELVEKIDEKYKDESNPTENIDSTDTDPADHTSNPFLAQNHTQIDLESIDPESIDPDAIDPDLIDLDQNPDLNLDLNPKENNIDITEMI